MRRIIDFSKRHSLDFNTRGDFEIYSPQYKWNDLLLKYQLPEYTEPPKRYCEIPKYSQCLRKLAERFTIQGSNMKTVISNSTIITNGTPISNGDSNDSNNIEINVSECAQGGCTITGVEQGDNILHIRKPMPASTKKCIERLGNAYIQCIIQIMS